MRRALFLWARVPAGSTHWGGVDASGRAPSAQERDLAKEAGAPIRPGFGFYILSQTMSSGVAFSGPGLR